jgi:very-short-patch-repair endonuclease
MAVDIAALRGVLRPFVGGLKDSCTNALMPEYCQQLGLPSPPDGGDKRGRLHAAFDALRDDDVPEFATGLLSRRMLGPHLRNEVQDLLWADALLIEMPKRSRRELARALQRLELFQHWGNFAQLLKDVFVIEHELSSVLFRRGGGTLEDIHRHFVRNPEDANVEALFEQVEALDLPDRRFCLLLEGLASADVQIDAETQAEVVAAMNPVLQGCGAELRQTSESGGYPVFSVVALRSARGRPKNLIFASSRKPDIRFRDAVNNDVEIVSNIDDVLVYDRPLGVNGLRWRDLQSWWAENIGESEAACAKKSLYRRLMECLPTSSPPQRQLFELYFRSFGNAIPNLPALLPEVWLHWDPKTVAQRGAQALLTHRMDFLMLLPGGARIVLEVDGMQHYADSMGRADPRQYARLAAGERELKLAGYEVYRFAGVELQQEDTPRLVKTFFEALFKRHGISMAT